MHGLVDSQTLDVRPIHHRRALVREAGRIEQRLQADVTGLRCWFDLCEQLGKGKSNPGNYHGPSFDTPQSIDAFFLGELQQLVEIESLRLVNQAADCNGPWSRHKSFRGGSDLLFVRRKLVEVVVVRNVLERGELLLDVETRFGAFIGKRSCDGVNLL